ncbi:hypothetical protein Misp04_06730 [Micromonospora sp. NBRC 101691]|nr:hypothetical protein Misp04_06730 [Micromonospora sp. NBRC 101691]
MEQPWKGFVECRFESYPRLSSWRGSPMVEATTFKLTHGFKRIRRVKWAETWNPRLG